MRTFTADRDGNEGLGSWDLACLRLPRSDKFQKGVKMEKVKTFELKFEDATGMLMMINKLSKIPLTSHRTRAIHRGIYIAGQLQDS